MSPLCSGVVGAWIVWRLIGLRLRIPWQVVGLTAVAPAAADSAASASSEGGEEPAERDPGGPPRRSSRSARGARSARRERREVEADLPTTVDLLHVAVTAGHSLHTAVAAVGRSGTGPVSRAFGEADRRFRRGGRLVDELDAVAARLGPAVRPLSTTLVVAASSGAPLGPTLQRLADAERRRLRRRTEERVRRLPVLLLAPLVGLVLPAFVLLTVVPVAITTARTGLLPAAEPPASAADATAPELPPTSTLRRPP